MLTGLSLDDSELVFDDDDDITMARSVTFNPKPWVHKVSTKQNCDLNGCVHGVAEAPLTNVVLPYVIDYWYARQATKCASIQILRSTYVIWKPKTVKLSFLQGLNQST